MQNTNKPIVEFLLWDNCNNNCKFCFLKHKNPYPSFLTDAEKASALEEAHKYLKSDAFVHGSHVLLCGGELFDTRLSEEAAKAWCNFINYLLNEAVTGRVADIYVNTNLIYDISTLLLPFLRSVNAHKLFPKLHFTTSYDLVGRFNTTEARNTFINNVAALKTEFPSLDIVSNMIMTKPVCTLICSGDLSVAALQEETGTTINLIPYIILTDDLAPSKELVKETLLTVEAELPGYMYTYVSRFSLNYSRVLLKYNAGKLVELTAYNSPCGHSENFLRYTTGNTCFVCDILKWKEELHNGIS